MHRFALCVHGGLCVHEVLYVHDVLYVRDGHEVLANQGTNVYADAAVALEAGAHSVDLFYETKGSYAQVYLVSCYPTWDELVSDQVDFAD